ncbi:hypothetical protein HKX48_008301 [Thoreauomyces humboldtii]|nr:hypothetical protein HKX48_008301 [Thoreauomyces humboldtii]
MGKSGKERKRRKLVQDATKLQSSTVLPVGGRKGILTPPLANSDNVRGSVSPSKRPLEEDDDAESDIGGFEELVGDLIPASALVTTIATLSALEANPEALRGKAFKGLRAAIHRLTQAGIGAGVGSGSSPSGRISDALTDGRWEDAMTTLAEMRAKGHRVPLGALQRWVRDCDAVSSTDGGLDGDPEVLRVLDAILRTADPSMVPAPGPAQKVVQRHPAWALTDTLTIPKPVSEIEGVLSQEEYRSRFRLVCHEKGPARRTPNEHDFLMYTTAEGTIKPAEPSHPAVTRHDVPHVPGAFLMQDVLSPGQCAQILAATEAIGFTPDAPIAGAASEQTSVLAHNLFWLADPQLLSDIFNRCQPHLPATLTAGPKASLTTLAGLNARWRVYRYVPGAIYRPHIDGAWPGSGLDPVTGEYVYDLYKDRRSKLTFLLYLNDNFEGGHTTFFTPAPTVGSLDAWPVAPRAGCVMCFPHGDAKGALLHEGSAVSKGVKYIIRADVLYTLPKDAGAL